MPKDLLTIVVSCTSLESVVPFNLTVASPASVATTGNSQLTVQPVLQPYLVDNGGKINFPVLGELKVGGLAKREAEQLIIQKGAPEYYRGVPMDIQLLPKTQVEMVISSVPVMDVINATRKALYTGHIGDGKIFVYDVEDVVKVRTGESGYDALQGEDD